MAHGEIHLELSVDYADDDKVRALAAFGKRARPARDLYVQMLCYCKRKMTDGRIPGEQVGILAYPDSLKDGLKDAELLVTVGLLEVAPGGYYMPGYLKRNKSKAAIEASALAKKAGAALGNHRRWHAEKPDPSCVHCTDGQPIAIPIGAPNPVLTPSESTKSESKSETETDDATSHSDVDPFDEFWQAYPRKVAKDDARKAFAKALKRASAETVIAGACRLRDDPNLPEKNFIPYPASWLNGGQWDDEPMPPRIGAKPWERIPTGQEHLPEHERFRVVGDQW